MVHKPSVLVGVSMHPDALARLESAAEVRPLPSDREELARGAILDEAALCRALQERRIAAAGLDVLVEEPIRAEHPLLALDNVVLAPHLGGSTKGCDMVLVEDTIRVLRDEEPIHPLY